MAYTDKAYFDYTETLQDMRRNIVNKVVNVAGNYNDIHVISGCLGTAEYFPVSLLT